MSSPVVLEVSHILEGLNYEGIWDDDQGMGNRPPAKGNRNPMDFMFVEYARSETNARNLRQPKGVQWKAVTRFKYLSKILYRKPSLPRNSALILIDVRYSRSARCLQQSFYSFM